MDERSLSESDVCDRFISPALVQSGWQKEQWRREFGFTDGRIIVRGQLVARGRRKRADYILFHRPHVPIALIEAKDSIAEIGSGMQQGLAYAETLDIPFVFSSNGKGFLFHDRSGTFPSVEMKLGIDEFPTPEDLWAHYQEWRGLDDSTGKLIEAPNFTSRNSKELRYYQQLAINRTIEAVVRGQRRVLLVMATGTGKTLTAFNIVWRLWKNASAKRILFLADRNILIDQTMSNDFKPFGDAMKKLDRRLVDKFTGRVDTSYEIYMSLYQAIIGGEGRESIYDKFPRDFFDLVVIDECHRGSAAEDSAWREILEYFSSAIHLGMTATPKETSDASNIEYFGEPVYTYSLKRGIEDGFLAPYKLIRPDLDIDLQGWRPEAGQADDYGLEIEDRIYNQKDIDRNIVFPQRDTAVAKRLSDFLHQSDPMSKTIVFCENVAHAERLRSALVNQPANRELIKSDGRYVMRITGDDDEGKAQLDNFIDPNQPYPVIATTSKLMTTGVDAQTCRVIVLDRRIQSMTEFKQIIGRGTRLRTDHDKYFFTIIDFRKASELFADPAWDGPPLQVLTLDKYGNVAAVDDSDTNAEEIDVVLVDSAASKRQIAPAPTDVQRREKYSVSGVSVNLIGERVQYLGSDGKLITESIRAFSRRALLREFATFDDFVRRWTSEDRKAVIVDELRERGVLLEAMETAAGKDMDAFDLIAHVAFDRPPLTRRERADNVRKTDVFSEYGEVARQVLDILVEKYADHGLDSMDGIQVLKVTPFPHLGTPMELVKSFGGRTQYLDAVQRLDRMLHGLDSAVEAS